jgi:hypothetical protein
MARTKTALFSITLFTVTGPSVATVTFVSKNLECSRLFVEQALSTVTNQQPIRAVTGEYANLAALLQRGGMKKEVAVSLAVFFADTLQSEAKTADNHVIRTTHRILQQLRLAGSPVLICILQGDCQLLENSESIHIYSANGPFWIRDFSQVPQQEIFEHPNFSQLIVTSPLTHPAGFWAWAAFFFLHLTEYADIHFLNEWLAANRYLDHSHMPTDALYAKYVRKMGPEIVLDYNFYYFFVSVRRPHALRPFLRKSVVMRDAVDMIYKNAESRPQPLLDIYRPNHDNIVQLGQEFGDQMDLTIHKVERIRERQGDGSQ